MVTALVIAGHGSHLSAGTAAPAWLHADTIRALGVFDEVTCAFWKESPSLRRVLETLTADDITVVPLFTSGGYFSKTLLPAELGAAGRRSEGRTVRYTSPLGEHPRMSEIVRQRIDATVAGFGLDPAQTAIAIAGHGTARDARSALATARQVEMMKNEGRFAEVVAIYMEESPEISEVYALTRSPNLVIVPFFVADGSHAQEDIPRLLGLSDDPVRKGIVTPTRIKDRAVYYTSAIGMEPSAADLILDLAVRSGAALKPRHEPIDPWMGFPLAGFQVLQNKTLPFTYGQIQVSEDGFGCYTVAPLGAPTDAPLLVTPASLRATVTRDPNGNFRALRTLTDLVACAPWRVQVNSRQALLAVLETVYPGLWIDVVQQQAGTLPVQSLRQTADRQTGMYHVVGELADSQQLQDMVHAHCGMCVRAPTWFNGIVSQEGLPCPEPCQAFMSFALMRLNASKKAYETLDLDSEEVASLIDALESAATHPEADVRMNNYAEARNPARLRALLIQLRGDPHLELPFPLETELEARICADLRWLKGANWGKPRPGHMEGKVMYHIRDVLKNVELFATSPEERRSLRLIALVHDTFKYQVDNALPRIPTNDHAVLGRRFGEEYITDSAILSVLEFHDEAYHCWRYGDWRSDWAAAEEGLDRLIQRFGEALPLYVRFYRCDNHTASKNPAPLVWFEDCLHKRGLNL
jgi:sirohydrochlorin cobaltochelatase